ncbi:hypothetical protein [Mycolicibacterium moriokaense]|uniref:DUF541 domain-containing protein n=1 Tax=Mycolicibacterium moriokaense TaxID=39691 RepID=A0A318H266_9MYCO|nr:hypothetical protein [Mycolicibacterium moriokaense]PXW96699.1 hypothetical protein C8E89_1516 [Mycolicibacterium moriokaense]
MNRTRLGWLIAASAVTVGAMLSCTAPVANADTAPSTTQNQLQITIGPAARKAGQIENLKVRMETVIVSSPPAQNEQRSPFNTLTNVRKSAHDAAMAAIQNTR